MTGPGVPSRPEDTALDGLRTTALVVSMPTALGAAVLLSLIISVFGAYALALTLGTLAGSVALTVAARAFALRRQPVRQRRFRWYALAEVLLVAGLLGQALVNRQPDLLPLLAVLSASAIGLMGWQVRLLLGTGRGRSWP